MPEEPVELWRIQNSYDASRTKAAKALPFIESSRWIHRNLPKKTSCITCYYFNIAMHPFGFLCCGGCAVHTQDCNTGKCHGHDQASGENFVPSRISGLGIWWDYRWLTQTHSWHTIPDQTILYNTKSFHITSKMEWDDVGEVDERWWLII